MKQVEDTRAMNPKKNAKQNNGFRKGDKQISPTWFRCSIFNTH